MRAGHEGKNDVQQNQKQVSRFRRIARKTGNSAALEMSTLG
jgi:hypothetical protein